MKKVYYFGSFLLIASIILFILFLNNINDNINIGMFVLFIGSSIYTNIRMSIVIRNPPQNKLSFKEKVNVFLFFLGKTAFILMLIRFGYFSSEINDIFMLSLFMLHQSLLLDYTYIYNNNLITLKRKPIDLDEICEFKTKQLWGQYYISSYINKDERLNFNLSKKEYIRLIKIKSI